MLTSPLRTTWNQRIASTTINKVFLSQPTNSWYVNITINERSTSYYFFLHRRRYGFSSFLTSKTTIQSTFTRSSFKTFLSRKFHNQYQESLRSQYITPLADVNLASPSKFFTSIFFHDRTRPQHQDETFLTFLVFFATFSFWTFLRNNNVSRVSFHPKLFFEILRTFFRTNFTFFLVTDDPAFRHIFLVSFVRKIWFPFCFCN